VSYRPVIAAFTTGVMLAGCSAGWSGPTTSLPSSTSADPAAAVPARGLKLVVSSPTKAQIAVTFNDKYQVGPISVYAMGNPKNKKSLCEITPKDPVLGAPGGDSDGNLWVPEFFGTSYVQSVIVEYEPNCGLPIFTLQDPYADARDVYVAADGKVYVANVGTGTNSPGNIKVYPKGQTSSTETLGAANKVAFIGVTANTKQHDIFATYIECSSCFGAGLMIFRNSGGAGVPIKDRSITFPGIPTIDKQGNVLVPDRSALHVFSPPYTVSGKTFHLKGWSEQCSLNKSQVNIACADYKNNTVDVYAYPSMKYGYSFSKGFDGPVAGIAQTPT
jgi:hypothetical protein